MGPLDDRDVAPWAEPVNEEGRPIGSDDDYDQAVANEISADNVW